MLTTALRLLHPYMPFVTEELWSHLHAAMPDLEPEHIIVAAWPESQEGESDPAVVEIDKLTEVVRAIRTARRESGVEPGRRIEAVVRQGAGTAILETETDFLTRLARIDPLVLLGEDESPPEKSISLIAGGMGNLPAARRDDRSGSRARPPEARNRAAGSRDRSVGRPFVPMKNSSSGLLRAWFKSGATRAPPRSPNWIRRGSAWTLFRST